MDRGMPSRGVVSRVKINVNNSDGVSQTSSPWWALGTSSEAMAYVADQEDNIARVAAAPREVELTQITFKVQVLRR
jgi:hypothetical protein